MMTPQRFSRLVFINFVLVRHGLDEIVLAIHLFRPIRWIAKLMPWNWVARADSKAVRLRRALEDLGPIFVKFGQILSTRADLLPPNIAQELAKLQDQVPPFDGRRATAIIEKALGQSVDTAFAEFDATPLASASVAQVHAARLHSGEDVVAKVIRPGVSKIIRRDMALLYTIAEMAERYSAEARRLHPVQVVEEFEHTLLDELDLMREAANASELRRNFDDDASLYVPKIHWELTRPGVMVMERVYGVPVADTDTLRERGVDLKKLSEMGVEIFFTQVFRDSFFHADMHPGNIMVDASDPANPNYIAIDFGIMGTLSPSDQHYLAENFLAFFNRDYRRVAELHIESGWVPPTTRVDEFESSIRTVSEPIFGKPLRDISFGQFLLRLFQTARRFDMEVQPQLVLLQKTLLSIEGLGRTLDPDLDLWATAKPTLERFMSEQVGWRAAIKSAKQQAPGWGSQLPELPGLTHAFLKTAVDGELKITQRSPQIDELRRDLKILAKRGYYAVLGGAMIISAALVFNAGSATAQGFFDIPIATWALGLLGCFFLALAWPGDD